MSAWRWSSAQSFDHTQQGSEQTQKPYFELSYLIQFALRQQALAHPYLERWMRRCFLPGWTHERYSDDRIMPVSLFIPYLLTESKPMLRLYHPICFEAFNTP